MSLNVEKLRGKVHSRQIHRKEGARVIPERTLEVAFISRNERRNFTINTKMGHNDLVRGIKLGNADDCSDRT